MLRGAVAAASDAAADAAAAAAASCNIYPASNGVTGLLASLKDNDL